jgi:hypothetical protein
MLNFQNAQVLALSQESQFLGSVFRYSVRRDLTVEGTLNNLTNFSGVSDIQSEISGFFNSDEDYQEILINGHSFGRGRINSISTPEGNDVQIKPYTVNLTCWLSGDYTTLFGPYYSGLAISGIPPADFSRLQSISENFDYTRSDSAFGYEHSVDLQFVSGFNVQSPIQSAKALARVLIDSNTPFGFLVTGDTEIGRKLYRESYDLISNQCSFTESYTRPINDSGIIFTATTSFNRDEAGISTITEDGSFELATPIDNYIEFNLPAQELNTFLLSAYDRAEEMFQKYSGENTYPLYTGYTSLSRTLIPHESAGSYNISFTNSPTQISGVSWEYTTEINKNGRFYNVGENGSIVGHGNPKQGYPKALNFYAGVKANAPDRVESFYTGEAQTAYPLYRFSEQKTLSEFNGQVNYSLAFTDDPSYGATNPVIKTEEISIEDSLPVRKINTFNIFNAKEIVQPLNNSTIGNRAVSINLVGQLGTNLDQFKEYAKDKANEFIPSGDDTFLNALSYSYNPNEKNFSLSAGWTFFRDARQAP